MTATTTPPRRRELLPDIVRRLAASPAYDQMVTDERAAAFERRKAIAARLAAELPALEKALAAAQKSEHAAALAAEAANLAARVASCTFTDAHRDKTGLEYQRDTRIADARRALQAAADPRIAAMFWHISTVRDRIPHAFKTGPMSHPVTGRPSIATNTATVEAAAAGHRAMLDELGALAIDASLAPDELRQRLVSMLDRSIALLTPIGLSSFPTHQIED